MKGLLAPFAIGIVAGLRSMSAAAALVRVASFGRSRVSWIPAGVGSRGLATTAALVEMAGDKLPFAPDRRIGPSVVVRLAIGAVGGVALAGRNAPPLDSALAGVAGAILGTLLGRAARGSNTRSGMDWARALAEDAMAAGLATAVVRSADRRGWH